MVCGPLPVTVPGCWRDRDGSVVGAGKQIRRVHLHGKGLAGGGVGGRRHREPIAAGGGAHRDREGNLAGGGSGGDGGGLRGYALRGRRGSTDFIGEVERLRGYHQQRAGRNDQVHRQVAGGNGASRGRHGNGSAPGARGEIGSGIVRDIALHAAARRDGSAGGVHDDPVASGRVRVHRRRSEEERQRRGAGSRESNSLLLARVVRAADLVVQIHRRGRNRHRRLGTHYQRNRDVNGRVARLSDGYRSLISRGRERGKYRPVNRDDNLVPVGRHLQPVAAG